MLYEHWEAVYNLYNPDNWNYLFPVIFLFMEKVRQHNIIEFPDWRNQIFQHAKLKLKKSFKKALKAIQCTVVRL